MSSTIQLDSQVKYGVQQYTRKMVHEYSSTLITKVWCIAMIVVSSQASNLTVTISTGTLMGAVHQSVEGRPFIAYRGIPYAKPPKDQMRFKVISDLTFILKSSMLIYWLEPLRSRLNLLNPGMESWMQPMIDPNVSNLSIT